MNTQHILFVTKNKDKYNDNFENTKIFTCKSVMYYSDKCSRKFTKNVEELNAIIYISYDFDKVTKFVNGKLFFREKEYSIKDFELYYYLEFDDKIHTKIGVCEIDMELMREIKNWLSK